jgi:DNA gyrase subunit B
MARKYDESSVEYLEGLEAVRRKPQMYIGATDSFGVWTIIREALDNCVDEFLAGRNKSATLVQDKNRFYVIDSGEGIPVGLNKKSGLSTLTLVVSKLHAGAKLSGGKNSAYEASRGTHGVGVSATNALSAFFSVHTCRDGQWWYTAFAKGKETVPVKKSKPPTALGGVKVKQGTVVTIEPDLKCFDKNASFKFKHFSDWAMLTSYLNAGLKISYVNTAAPKTNKEWFSKKGAVEYLDKTIEELKAGRIGKPFLLNDKHMEVALAFTDYDGQRLQAFTNGLSNIEGGEHVLALHAALSKALKPYMGRKEFSATALRDGLVGIVNYKIAAPRFNSQTKEKLVDERVKPYAKPLLEDAFKKFFAANKTMAKSLCVRAEQLSAMTAKFHASKKAARQIKTASNASVLLPGKLTVAPHCKPEQRELFITEGDSASGTAKQARYPEFQEILGLKGKPVNVYKLKKGADVLDNEELRNILVAIGYRPDAKDPLAKLRVKGKIILLPDADPDGDHIRCLVLGALMRTLPELFKDKIYIVKAPEYIVEHDGARYYADTIENLKKKLPSEKLLRKMIHLKGWGEVSAGALREFAFDKNTRVLYQVKEPSQESVARLVAIMGEDTTARKELLGI